MYGEANNNTVNITGTDVSGAFVLGGRTDNGNVSGNTVTLKNAITNAGTSIFGGHSSNGNATYNTANLEGGPYTLESLMESMAPNDGFTGNTLNISTRATVREFGNFEYQNFTLPADNQANEPIITASGTTISSILVSDTVLLKNRKSAL